MTGVDPAAASIDVARAKPGADRVRWVVGEIDAVADLRFDLVTMTGNVAQVFVTDEAWRAMLATAHDVVRPGGHLVFETRDPAREAWREWTREESATVADTPGRGPRRVVGGGDRRARRAGHLPLDPGVHRRHDHLGVDPALPQPRRGDGRPGGGRLRGRGRPRGARPAGSGDGVRGLPTRRVAGAQQGAWLARARGHRRGPAPGRDRRGRVARPGAGRHRAGVPRRRDASGPVRAQRRRRGMGARPSAAPRRGARRQRRARRRLRQRAADGVAGGVGRRGRPHGLGRTASRSPPGSPTWRAPGCRTGPTASGPATR